MFLLGKVGKGHNITRVVVVAAFVGYPHLYAVYAHARYDGGQLGHRTVVVVAEIVGKEEVLVLVVVGYLNLVCCELCAALRVHNRAVRCLLRYNSLQRQLAELEIGPYTKERRCSLYEARVCGKCYVTGLQQFYHLVFFSLVFEVYFLGIVAECGFGVVVEVHIHFVAHASLYVQVYLLVEVEGVGLAVAFA